VDLQVHTAPPACPYISIHSASFHLDFDEGMGGSSSLD
jgi:hypothetical protein